MIDAIVLIFYAIWRAILICIAVVALGIGIIVGTVVGALAKGYKVGRQ